MFIVMKGRLGVTVRMGNEENAVVKELANLTKGAVLGEMSLLLGKPRSATVFVQSQSCTLAEISDGTLEALWESRPDLQLKLAKIAQKRHKANLDCDAEDTDISLERTESEQSTWFKEAMRRETQSSPEREQHEARGVRRKPTRASVGPIQEIKLKEVDGVGVEDKKQGEQQGATTATAAQDAPWLDRWVDQLLQLLLRICDKLMSRFRCAPARCGYPQRRSQGLPCGVFARS